MGLNKLLDVIADARCSRDARSLPNQTMPAPLITSTATVSDCAGASAYAASVPSTFEARMTQESGLSINNARPAAQLALSFDCGGGFSGCDDESLAVAGQSDAGRACNGGFAASVDVGVASSGDEYPLERRSDVEGCQRGARPLLAIPPSRQVQDQTPAHICPEVTASSLESAATPHEAVSSVQTELVANAIPRAFGKCGPNDTKAFESWLLAEGKVCLPEIAAAYSKAISKIEEMSPRFGLAVCKLYGNLDVSDVAYQAGILSANTVFKAYNNRWCGRPLRALDCFVEYVRTGGGVACKPTALSTNAKKAPLDEGSVAASLLVHASAEATIAPTGQVAPVGSDSSDSNETYDRVARVVMDCFPNGARPGSIIDRNKIRRLYVERFNGSGLEDDEIIRALQARALIYNDKAYVLSDEAMECLRARCDEWVASGQRMFFYDELYRAYAEEFAEEKIFSSELLCTVLKLVEPHFVFYDAHFSVRRGITIEDELLRAFGDALVLSFEEIKVRLRFIPDDSLVPVLRRSVHFANAGQGDYVFLDNVTIDLQDASEAFRAVDEAIECNGFAPLRILDVERTRGENPGLSELGARNALYEKVLADSFDRKGSLLARHGERVSTRAVMCSWCLDHDGLSLNEMDDFVERELCNQGSAQLLRVAFDTMVRIEADKFVADGYVDFDVESVDAALALFVGDGIMPIKSITSFTSFPDVGRSWNLFLLGSYVHRFSARYQLGGEPVRGASVGAIYPKTVHFDGYVDLLARVLANSGVSLDDRTAGDYLVEQGFVARRAKITRDAATRARLLRG